MTTTDDPAAPVARNPRREAQELAGERFEARVLEPSPPANLDPQWFADDPVARGEPRGRLVVGPTSGADLTWDDFLKDRPDLEAWAAARWLGAYRRLARPPATFVGTRLALHRVAVYAVSPARRRANGKIALRWTFGGLGTPFFGDDEQVRITAGGLVRQRGDRADAAPFATLAAAAAFVLDGPADLAWAEGFDVPDAGDLQAPLAVDAAAAALLGDWYGFASSVLEELRARPASAEASRMQLWPEHFDAAFDGLSGDRRATFGASPGDGTVPEPYLYVLPARFDAVPASALWNAGSFRGAILRLGEFVDAADQRAAALAFFRERIALLEA
jgi:hypothetical protein